MMADCASKIYHNLLGIRISVINMQDALETMACWIKRGKKNYVCVVPAHSVMDAYRQTDLRSIFNEAGMCTPDGMGVVWSLKLAGFRNVSRVYGPELMLAVCERSLLTGWKHYFYGGAPGVAEKLAQRLIDRYPGLKVVGVHSPPYRPLTKDEDRMVVDEINASGADIVWVGISSPKQEIWMSQHLGRSNAPVMVGVGAAFDFLSGHKKQAPRWIQRSGFEWLYRLVREPRRLWRRYAQYPLFVLLVTAQLLGLKKFSEGR